MKIKDSVVVITGGAKGLGKSLVKSFSSKGAHVVMCDKNITELDSTSKDLGVTGIPADVTNEADLSEVLKKVILQFGHVDIWVNNAGVWMPPVAIENVDMEKARKLFEINVFGTIHGIRTASKQMKLQNNGTIVNIVSTTAFDGMNGSSGSMYVASKYALRGLTNVAREEVKENNIKIIGVYPGGMKTDIFSESIPKNLDLFMSADDIAEKIVTNLELAEPLEQLVLKRPEQTLSSELK
jgi:uncharacterized protein